MKVKIKDWLRSIVLTMLLSICLSTYVMRWLKAKSPQLGITSTIFVQETNVLIYLLTQKYRVSHTYRNRFFFINLKTMIPF